MLKHYCDYRADCVKNCDECPFTPALHFHCCQLIACTQVAQGYGMTISFDQFKAIILGGSKDTSTFSRRELELAFVSLQSHKDPKGKINQPRLRELMRSFGPKTDQETTRKHLQLMREYTSEASFDFCKLLQALEDEGILTKEPKHKPKTRKKPKTPATPASGKKTPASRGTALHRNHAARICVLMP